MAEQGRYRIRYNMASVGPLAILNEKYNSLLTFLPGLRRIILVGKGGEYAGTGVETSKENTTGD